MPDLITDAQEGAEKLNQPEYDDNLIYHCSSFRVHGNGGAETYLTSLIQSPQSGVSDFVIKSLKELNQSRFKLLHIHSPDLLEQVKGECPTVFTVHNHSLYCASGTKYLAAQDVICDRNFSYLGCLWGKIIDGCGSRKPARVIQELQSTHHLNNFIRNLKVTFLANSDYVRKQLIKNGLPPQQTVTLRCGISVPQIATAPLSLETYKIGRILFVGRIVPDKGLEWLLKTLVHTDSQIHLDIAGEGWERPRLEKLAQKLGLNNRITWHGWCDSNKLNQLYEQCFAVIFPSVWPEPAGLVTLEAYAHYRPVIASAVGGIPEYLQDGETGVLVPANNIKMLAQAITHLSSDYQKCRQMGEQGHALLMQEFTMDVHVKYLQKIYENTISEFVSQKN
ncbi:MAG: glycosyltransferase family 4 protein [Brasilonema angustatum HA4187-MV1]|jgi:glycosyltransferase involved in cell wall biosynthesis|nr:glycosyltransferase family 4 protein [Brasilonema angustatum HA4187-MV1]